MTRDQNANFTTESDIKSPTQTALIADRYDARLFRDWSDSEDANADWRKAPGHVRLQSGFLRIKYANGAPERAAGR